MLITPHAFGKVVDQSCYPYDKLRIYGKRFELKRTT